MLRFLMLHELANTTTSRLFYLPKLEAVTRRIWMRATVKVLDKVLTRFGMDCDIDLTPDGKLTVTRRVDGHTVTEEAFTDEQIGEAMRSADSTEVHRRACACIDRGHGTPDRTQIETPETVANKRVDVF